MNRRKIFLIILIVIVVLLVLAALYFALWWKKPTNVNTANNAVNTTANANLVNTANLNANLPVNEEAKTKVNLATIAQSFAERFGTYSNQNNFENILNLQDLMSDKLKTWSDQYIAGERAKAADTTTYHGVSTKAISYQTVSYDTDKGAEFLINTQRVESSVTPTNVDKTYYQEITIKIIKEKGDWKVDEVKWK